MTDAILRASQVSKSYGSSVALEPLDLELGEAGRGSITGLLGPNGSGKSTFLRILIGLVPPDAGEVTIDGARLSGDGTEVRRRATYAPGEIALFREMTGAEHLRWLLRGRDSGALNRGRQLCERLGLPLDKPVQAYSHGMKRQLLL
ncbi:MAG: ATP-binding cassette domain-containing protein, partial [Planctomycetota bacterium]